MNVLTPSELNAVSSVGFFRGFNRENIDRINASAGFLKIAKREVLYRQGDLASAIFVILRGGIKLYQSTPTGHEAIIDILSNGESLGLEDALNGRRHSTTAEAISNARVLRVPIDHLLSCLRVSPDIALSVFSSAFDQFHRLMRQVAQLKAQSALQRLAEFLASLCFVETGPCVVTLPYDKGLIAGQLGITREFLSRAFASLKKIGVEVKETSVKISDVSKLRRLAAEDQI